MKKNKYAEEWKEAISITSLLYAGACGGVLILLGTAAQDWVLSLSGALILGGVSLAVTSE